MTNVKQGANVWRDNRIEGRCFYKEMSFSFSLTFLDEWTFEGGLLILFVPMFPNEYVPYVCGI